MTKSIPEIVGAITSDSIAVLMGQPPVSILGASVATTLANYQQRQAQNAHEILMEELNQGKRLPIDTDLNSFCSLLFRYINAARNGAARIHLRLLAQLILNGSLNRQIEIDKLTSYSDLLASLNYDEIVVLASMLRAEQKAVSSGSYDEQELAIAVMQAVDSDLVPNVFNIADDFAAVQHGLVRTGLVLPRSTWDRMRMDISPKLRKLHQLCSFEEAMISEPRGRQSTKE